jgi:hypothetical protein
MTKALSSELQEQIHDLAIGGMRTTHIALQLGIDRNSTAKYRKAMGLSPTPILPKKKLLALLKSRRMGQREIARTLHIPYRKVYAFAQEHGFARPHKKLSGSQALQLIDDILQRRGSAAALAKKYNCSYKRVLELAHRLLQCERFLPSWRTPLSSYLPSRPPQPMSGSTPQQREALALYLVDMVNRATGRFPETEKIIEICTLIVAAIYSRENPAVHIGAAELQRIQTSFEPHLLNAIDATRIAESGPVN